MPQICPVGGHDQAAAINQACKTDTLSDLAEIHEGCWHVEIFKF